MQIRSLFLALAAFSNALVSVTAFPSMRTGTAPTHDQVKRGLQAMTSDPNLIAQIRSIWASQQEDLRRWKVEGKRDVVGSLLNDTIDAIIGPEDGILAGLANSFAAQVDGLKRFPEDDHPFQWPSDTDQRGPCPGLNTLANHGYISRNGIVTAGEVIAGTAELFNMGVDVAAFLLAGSVALDGDIPTLRFSIGGADGRTNSLGKLGGLLGTETGLDGHGRFNEGDLIPHSARCDFYLCDGDNHNMQPELFAQMREQAKAHGNQYNVRAMAKHFYSRYQDSVTNNPNFYFVPPSAIVVVGATYFIPAFFSNATIGAGGVANEASIASFEGAHFNSDGTITYVPERIPPQGWYRRGVPMTLVELIAGFLAVYGPNPVLFDLNGLGCFLYNALYADFFGEFYNIVGAVEGGVNALLGLLDPALSDFIGCTPNFPDETDPNSYGGALSYIKATSGAPGAPKSAPCQLGPNSECVSESNSYGMSESDYVGNRYEFTGTEDASGNPLPSGAGKCGEYARLPSSYFMRDAGISIKPDDSFYGGFGDVYRGSDKLERKLAIKRLRWHMAPDPESRKRLKFCMEAVLW
ncbi:hypothetical protein PUNSTDRAFT_145605 [Punctularia strigosozonata HHB-11173 SS5]|uniref:uncharacterized protein n=1 Tax=Punctularia strigosozonata (strain HHB-11173) TaxID=741275 RepID=UPI00044186EC|nr:uncharacterized protein PUNSTDRAFT_145605 [Punctularia strigosozonata HHB-11173 SS5]EIN06351.1 hypothetical protein PUNSTDRAFT_145605 [Punctularia strigosozonata HHB-11173 SS5]